MIKGMEGILLKTEITMEIEGDDKPAFVAESLYYVYYLAMLEVNLFFKSHGCVSD